MPPIPTNPAPPLELPPEEPSSQASVQGALSFLNAALGTGAAVGAFAALRPGQALATCALVGAHSLCAALARIWVRRSGPRAGLAAYFGMGIAIANVAAAFEGGVFSSATALPLLFIGAGAVMLGPRAGLALAGWQTLCVGGLFALGSHGMLPPPSSAPSAERKAVAAIGHALLFAGFALGASGHFRRMLGKSQRELASLDAALDASPEPMFVASNDPEDPASIVALRANKAFAKMASRGGHQLPSLPLGSDPASIGYIAHACRERLSLDDFEVAFVDERGSTRTLSLSIRPIPWDGLDACLCSFSDRTESLAAQRALREVNASLEARSGERAAQLLKTQRELLAQEKLASLGSMVAGVAHELNTPIGNAKLTASTLMEAAESIRAKAADGSMRRSDLERHLRSEAEACALLMSSLERSSELISQFKQISADRSSSAKRRFMLGQTIKETLAMHGPALRGLACRIEVDFPEGPAIELDSHPGPLGQVLSNLINNSILHAFEGREAGRIDLLAWVDHASSQAVIRFRDDGVGIPASVLPRIFDPFYTTKLGQGGTGLGMYIVHNIVADLLGGSIVAESTPGQGACFTLTIPLSAPERA